MASSNPIIVSWRGGRRNLFTRSQAQSERVTGPDRSSDRLVPVCQRACRVVAADEIFKNSPSAAKQGLCARERRRATRCISGSKGSSGSQIFDPPEIPVQPGRKLRSPEVPVSFRMKIRRIKIGDGCKFLPMSHGQPSASENKFDVWDGAQDRYTRGANGMVHLLQEQTLSIWPIAR